MCGGFAGRRNTVMASCALAAGHALRGPMAEGGCGPTGVDMAGIAGCAGGDMSAGFAGRATAAYVAVGAGFGGAPKDALNMARLASGASVCTG